MHTQYNMETHSKKNNREQQLNVEEDEKVIK